MFVKRIKRLLLNQLLENVETVIEQQGDCEENKDSRREQNATISTRRVTRSSC